MKICIKNGIIVDGSGQDAFYADIVLQNDRILDIGHYPDAQEQFDRILDAHDAYVTPGFIDTHTHTDVANFLPQGLRPKIMQGVTTEVIGQCGLGVAPLPKEKQEGWRSSLIIGNPPIPWPWETMQEYLQALEVYGLESNLVPFVGHGTLRYALREDRAGTLTPQELQILRGFVEEAFEAGVFGISFGFIYVPALFSDQRELQVVMEAVSQHHGIIAVHLRSESDELPEALQDMLELAAGYHCRLHLSHLKAIGRRNRQKINKVFDFVEQYHLTFDMYPYFAGSTTLLSIFPPFVVEGNGLDETLQKLQDPTIRHSIKQLFRGETTPPKGLAWDNLPNLLGWENIFIADIAGTEYQNMIGRSLADIAQQRACDPADAAVDLIIGAHGRVRMLDYYEDESTLLKILSHPSGMIGTDTLLGGRPHPRVFGSYPKIIHTYVFERKVLSLETAISKMTDKPAEMLGLRDRGLLRPDYIADLIIFDKHFRDRATFDKPELYPEGLKYVIINGEIKVDNGQYCDNRPGRVIRLTIDD